MEREHWLSSKYLLDFTRTGPARGLDENPHTWKGTLTLTALFRGREGEQLRAREGGFGGGRG